MRVRFAALSVFAALVLTAGTLGAQSGQASGQQALPAGERQGQNPPPPPKNLQVLPKDISRQELQATMRGFTRALGVECNFCHVAEGRGGRNDFAADEKDTKIKARVMLKMVAHINEMLTTELGEPADEVVKVECATCHRGSQIPKVEMPPAPAGDASRPPAAR